MEKQKLKNHTHRVFNILEKPMMEFIANYLECPADVVFLDPVPQMSEPVVLNPIEKYKKNTYLQVILETQNYEKKSNILSRDYIKFKEVKTSIAFLKQCVEIVYGSLLAKGLKKEYQNILKDKVIQLDESNMSFKLVYKNEITKKIDLRNNCINELINSMQQNKEEKTRKSISQKINECAKEIVDLKKQLTPEIIEKQKEQNQINDKKLRLFLNIKEITKEVVDQIHQNLQQ